MGRKKKEVATSDNVEKWLAGTSWEAKRPLTALERQHRHREAARELGEIPSPRHPTWRESCRLDLLKFGILYGGGRYAGMKPLLKRRPSPRMISFVEALQEKILHGGLKHVRWPRGKGKSTWVKIGVLWAALYGHLRFMVVVERVKGAAQVVVEEIWKRIYTSPRIAADFPEVAIPLRDVSMTPQKMRQQTFKGEPTFMKQDIMRFNYFKLPTMKGMPWTGAMLAFRGADQALRGINIESSRPDFFFIDDPQTDTDARNPTTVANIEDNINGAVLGSGETDETISAIMATTPIEPDDVSEIFADPKRHAEWETVTEKFVEHFGPEALMAKYLRLLDADADEARRFYIENKDEIEKGASMMDDGDFDPTCEVSAYQHALNLRHRMKDRRFLSEYQMYPSRSVGIYKINPLLVRSRVNGHKAGEVPHECDQGLLAFVDVNATAGLRWEIGAFGAGRRVAILAYGQYPAPGVSLYPEGVSTAAIPKYLAPALRTVAQTILGVKFFSETGEEEKVRGICFDGGWMTDTVATVVSELKASGIVAEWSKGYDSKSYSNYHHEQAKKVKGLKSGEWCHTWGTSNGTYLAFNSDYWKEVSQTSFLAEPLTESSSSFYGEPAEHLQFAQELCNEELRGKEDHPKYGTVYTWHKERTKPNHYGDTHAGLLCFGAIRGNFDAVAKFVAADDIVRQAKQKRRRYVYKHV